MFVQSSVICSQLKFFLSTLFWNSLSLCSYPVTTELPTAMRSSFALETPYNILYCCLYHWYAIYAFSVPSDEVLDSR